MKRRRWRRSSRVAHASAAKRITHQRPAAAPPAGGAAPVAKNVCPGGPTGAPGRRSSPVDPAGSAGPRRIGAAVGLGARLFIATPRAGGAVGGRSAATGGSVGGRAATWVSATAWRSRTTLCVVGAAEPCGAAEGAATYGKRGAGRVCGTCAAGELAGGALRGDAAGAGAAGAGAASAGAGAGEALPASVVAVFCVAPPSAVPLAPVSGVLEGFAPSLPVLVLVEVPEVVELASLVVFVLVPFDVVTASVPVGGAGSAVTGPGAGGVVVVASSAVTVESGAGTAASCAAAAAAAAVATDPVCSACTTVSAAAAVEAAEPTTTVRSVAIKTHRRVS